MHLALLQNQLPQLLPELKLREMVPDLGKAGLLDLDLDGFGAKNLGDVCKNLTKNVNLKKSENP
jgi:hypothetical protein